MLVGANRFPAKVLACMSMLRCNAGLFNFPELCIHEDDATNCTRPRSHLGTPFRSQQRLAVCRPDVWRRRRRAGAKRQHQQPVPSIQVRHRACQQQPRHTPGHLWRRQDHHQQRSGGAFDRADADRNGMLSPRRHRPSRRLASASSPWTRTRTRCSRARSLKRAPSPKSPSRSPVVGKRTAPPALSQGRARCRQGRPCKLAAATPESMPLAHCPGDTDERPHRRCPPAPAANPTARCAPGAH